MSSTRHPATASPGTTSSEPRTVLPAEGEPRPLPAAADRPPHPLFGGLGDLGDLGVHDYAPYGCEDFGGSGLTPWDAEGSAEAAARAEGAAWLASASAHPRSTLALWREHPATPVVLSCGPVFDVVNAPAVFGRRMLDQLWAAGSGGPGPVAAHHGRVLLFASPGTAARLPSLLHWEEWGSAGRHPGVPPLLCHGTGDAVTVPPPAAALTPGTATRAGARPDSRWLVAPECRRPRLPGAEVLLWACVRAARSRPARGASGQAGGLGGDGVVDFSPHRSGC
ncbi:bifunctional DNA primase/polymerase [Streptomyces sp. SCSIO ZS0520]|uniref:bifunctional DNA primase/polymerase n=1 Tax=Streptomyces sp. SCSIO ZS0520 TaxID=2892996 RepID=UPI003985EBC6